MNSDMEERKTDMGEKKLRTREEADWKDTWAVEDLYRDDGEWEKDAGRLENRIGELAVYRGRLGESAEVLLAMQRTGDELNMLA